jgi:hypothetical protein
MKTMRRKAIELAALLAAAMAIGAAGCNLEPGVPGQPGYEADVKPILEARCIRCHSYPQIANATPGVRFDVYDCSQMPDAGLVCTAGAKDVAGLMPKRLQVNKDDGLHMPPKPAAPLSQYQVDTIVKWAAGIPPAP